MPDLSSLDDPQEAAARSLVTEKVAAILDMERERRHMNLTPEFITAKLTESHVPTHMHDSLILWLTEGAPPGSFLTAILSNDLREACARADDINKHHLYDIVFFLYNYAPIPSWGSEAHVMQWAREHQRRRTEANA